MRRSEPALPERKTGGAVKADHDRLRETLEELSEILDGRKDAVDARRQLESLRKFIEHHFKVEEQGGFFSHLIERAPHLATRAQNLLGQHPLLLASARRLLAAARAPKSSDWWQRVAERFSEFREAILEHENRENQLLQEAFNQDLGSLD